MNRYSIAAMLAATSVVPAFAQAGGNLQSSMMSFLPMMLVMIVVVYFFMIKPEQKKAKDKQSLMDALKKGEKILTIGGMYGTVHAVHKNTISIRIADNTVVDFAKSAIAEVVTKDPDAEPVVEKK